uniref:WD repeat-containing protein 76 n=1 Tax=Globisporangium ultimum (strain ATCC 200006 / CBS 805.95 / DAOM BR144) TaxID=431595 RepID=K3W540_GLOUD
MKHEPLPERKPLVDVKPPAKAALLANGKADEMTEYERKRLENIQRNLDFMKSMGVSTAKIAARTAVGAVKAPSKGIPTKRKPSEPPQPTRKSRRIQGKQSENLALPASWPVNDVPRAGFNAEDPRTGRFDVNLTAEAVNVSSASGRSFLDSIAGGVEEKESDLKVDATGVETVNYQLSSEDIVKATEERIYSIVFHSRQDKLVVATGDKRGNLSLWSADEPSDAEDVVVMYRPHTLPITQLHFAPEDSTKLVSASFDGSIREFDLKAGAFSELYGTQDDVGITSMTLDIEHNAYLISCDDGHVCSVDRRESQKNASRFLLHEKKINTVHQHPEFRFCLATASLDRTVCLWDSRKLSKSNNKPLVTMPHERSVNCAYFSPTGDHLVTVGLDNYVNLFNTGDAKHHDAHSVAPTLAIPHNNQTGRWLTKLHATWDPKHKDRFVIGCMQQPRRIQLFKATRKNPIQELTSEYFNSVHSINVFHPTLDAICGGNSSGRLSLWRGSK